MSVCYNQNRKGGDYTLDYQRITAHLIGNATRDADAKLGRESGKSYGDFHLAVRVRKERTTYFPVRCFGKLMDGMKGIKKGTEVFVDGEMKIASFKGEDGENTDKPNGEVRSSVRAPGPSKGEQRAEGRAE